MTKEETEIAIREKLRLELTKLGVTNMKVCYEGSGDEGAIEDVYIMSKRNKKYVQMLKISSDIYTMFDSILENNIDGWETDAGGRGIIFWNINKDEIKLCHNQHYTASNYSEIKGL